MIKIVPKRPTNFTNSIYMPIIEGMFIIFVLEKKYKSYLFTLCKVVN